MLKLSHLLPPDAAFGTTSDPSTDDPPDQQCPRSIIGAVPPSAPLHLAIAHQLGRKTYESFGKLQQEAVDDFTVLETTVNQSHTEVTSPQSVLIIASARSKWHELLIMENSSWLQEHGGNPRIADALHRTDIKYCSNAKEALVLLTLLHMQTDDNVATMGENDASTLSGEPPSLIVTWDLLNLFLEPQANEENGPDPVGNESEVQVESIGKSEVDVASAREPSSVHFLDGTSPQDYLSLISALRQAVEQLGDITPGGKAELVILEPRMTSTMEVPAAYPAQPQPPTRPNDRKKQQTFNLAKGLYWLMAPGYRDPNSNRLAISSINVDRQTSDMVDSPSRQPEPQRFVVENLSGDTIALFERLHDQVYADRPWLDREGSTYRWAQVSRL